VEFIWVKGHADNPGNNSCDELARLGAANAVKDDPGGATEA
jgi:ribonuclease HI